MLDFLIKAMAVVGCIMIVLYIWAWKRRKKDIEEGCNAVIQTLNSYASIVEHLDNIPPLTPVSIDILPTTIERIKEAIKLNIEISKRYDTEMLAFCRKAYIKLASFTTNEEIELIKEDESGLHQLAWIEIVAARVKGLEEEFEGFANMELEKKDTKNLLKSNSENLINDRSSIHPLFDRSQESFSGLDI